jgi:hypothetical protein
MFKRICILVVTGLLLISTVGTQAQDNLPLYARDYVPVEAVEWFTELDTLHIRATGTLSDSCDEVLWDHQWTVGLHDAILFINLYREVRPEVTCAFQETPYAFVLPVQDLIAEQIAAGEQFVLVVNDHMLRINWPEADSTELPYALQLSRGSITVETITLTPRDTAMTVTLEGEMGCGYLVRRILRDYTNIDSGSYRAEAYMAIDPAISCVTGVIPFTSTLETDATMSTPLNVNGFLLTPEVMTDVEPMEQTYSITDMPVDSVEALVAESMPPQLMLTVRGITDGCDYPIQMVIDPQQEGNPFINARVARVAPLAIACPAIALEYSAQGSLTFTYPGEFTLVINGEERETITAAF